MSSSTDRGMRGSHGNVWSVCQAKCSNIAIFIQFNPYSFNLISIFIQFNPYSFSLIPTGTPYSFNSIFRSIQFNLIQFDFYIHSIQFLHSVSSVAIFL